MLQKPRLCRFQSLGPHGFHQVAYTEWGNPRSDHIVVCVHGLTRNSRDFDALAASLADRYRIVCMDVVGRGSSDWLRHKGDYGFPLYLSDAAALLARITAPLPSTRLRRALYGSPRAIGPIPGELMLLGSILFIGGWITFAIVTLYLDRAKHGGKPIRVAMG